VAPTICSFLTFKRTTNNGWVLSVVQGNIQPAKALDRLIDETAHVIFVADVSAHEFRFGAKSAQFSDQCLPSVVAPTGNDDARTFLSERKSGGAADAGKRARDEYDWVVVHVLCPSSD
jgi:hypothetical protein